MNSARKLHTLTGLFIGLCSAPFVLWSIWPAGVSRQVLEIPSAQLDPASPPQAENRQLLLEIPRSLRAGDPGTVRLTLSGSDGPGAAGSGAGSGTVEVQARLDLPGVKVEPPGVISQPLLPGKPAVFSWQVRSDQPRRLPGKAWLFLRSFPADGRPVSEKAVSAQGFSLQASLFLGLASGPARVLGGIGSAGGLAVLLLGWIAPSRVANQAE